MILVHILLNPTWFLLNDVNRKKIFAREVTNRLAWSSDKQTNKQKHSFGRLTNFKRLNIKQTKLRLL
jgi:hypothetical protein